MKRYRNMAVIAAVTTLSIGVFYTKIATSESKLPNFYLATEKGDSELAKNIEVDAGYSEVNFLTVTNKGSDYRSHLSLIDEIHRDLYDDKELNDLLKEEKNFMRGKNSPSNFYVDKDYVWYADVKGKNNNFDELENNEFKLYVDGLDRENKDRFRFTIDIPNEEKYSYISVGDVQLVDKELVVKTYQHIRNSSTDENEHRLYHINLSQKKVVKNTLLSSFKNSENMITDLYEAIEAKQTKPKKYDVSRETKNKQIQQANGEVLSEPSDSKIHIVNLATSKEEKLNLTKEQFEKAMQSEILQDDNYLYFVSQSDFSYMKYSLERQKLEGAVMNIHLKEGTTYDGFKVSDGYLYAKTTNENALGKKSVIVVDLSDGQTIYEGTIKVKASKYSKEQLKNLFLYDVSVN